MKGAATGLPFLLNCYPMQQESGPTYLELFQACLSWIPEGKGKDIVVSDTYYMDDASATLLRASGFMHLAAINPTSFKEVWQAYVQYRGQSESFLLQEEVPL